MSLKTDPLGNTSRYFRGPTPEEVAIVIKSLGMTIAHFERYFGLNDRCVKQHRRGYRPFPKKHWHVVFENLPDQSVRDFVLNHPSKAKFIAAKKIIEDGNKPKKQRAKKKRKVLIDEKIEALW